MQAPTYNHVRNRLLASLSEADYEALHPSLELVTLNVRDVLIEADALTTHAYFIESGIVSSVATTMDGVEVEVGVTGLEGLIGTSLLLSVDRTPHKNFVQVAGEALRVKAADVRAIVDRHLAIWPILTRYAHCFHLQVAHTALANGKFGVEQRLARWLLMCHDRVEGDEFPITHEFLSVMLGARRPGVTVAVQVLEGEHMIRAQRGRITILDRQKLITAASGSYGLPEREYRRLIEPTLTPG